MAAVNGREWSALDRLRALVLARGLLDVDVERLAGECWEGGCDRTELAFALGVSRATLYRQFGGLPQAAP